MSRAAARVAAAAQAAVGVRFRLHGRAMETGLDCVGLAGLCLAAAGVRQEMPCGYGLRRWDLAAADAWASRAGLVVGAPEPGAVLLCDAGRRQLHLAILVEDGVVHADAGLGRIVLRPGAVAWPVLRAWRVGARVDDRRGGSREGGC